MRGWMRKSFSFIILTNHYRNTDVCMNHIADGPQIHVKKPDPGLNYTEKDCISSRAVAIIQQVTLQPKWYNGSTK